MIFIETHIFTKRLLELLDDDSYAEFQRYLALHPEAGDLIEQISRASYARMRSIVR